MFSINMLAGQSFIIVMKTVELEDSLLHLEEVVCKKENTERTPHLERKRTLQGWAYTDPGVEQQSTLVKVRKCNTLSMLFITE